MRRIATHTRQGTPDVRIVEEFNIDEHTYYTASADAKLHAAALQNVADALSDVAQAIYSIGGGLDRMADAVEHIYAPIPDDPSR